MAADQRGPGPIPDRWLYCPRKSDTVICERFLAFKTPLNEKYESQMPLECVFTPDILFSYVKTLRLKLGLWIDLTYTRRFYDRGEVEKHGTKYVKLQCRGHGETPSEEQTGSFINIVDEFVNDRPLDLIGVHCTHGFNRTGFLIVCYMVERMDCSVEAALQVFAAARPPGIYKEDYIKELYRRYEDIDDAPAAPELPDWCFEPQRTQVPVGSKRMLEDNEDDQVENDAEENEGQSNGRKKRRKENVLKNATFMEGVPGVHLFLQQPKLSELHAKVQDMCKWEKSGFPGCQPVSMDHKNITNLHIKPYRVSWKADGTRYMMLIDGRDEIYFFDRNFSCFQVENLSFPRASNFHEHLANTLLDGEMVIDKFQGKHYPRYLIYDIIQYDGEDMIEKPFFPDRLSCIDRQITRVRYDAIMQGKLNRALEPFSIRAKEFWDIRQASYLMGERFARKLTHEPDGLIFQPSKEFYTPGQCPDVLKWKPLSMNSIDFKLRITKQGGMGVVEKKIGVLLAGREETPLAQIRLTKDIKHLNNRIIECTFRDREWVFLRERTDKTFPNSYETAMSVWESIKNPVTTEQLLMFIEHHRFKDDAEIMPPPRPQHVYH